MTDRLKEIEALQHMKMDQVCPHCGLTPEQGPRRTEGDGAEIVRELRRIAQNMRPPFEGDTRHATIDRAADYIEAMGGVPADNEVPVQTATSDFGTTLEEMDLEAFFNMRALSKKD